MTHVEPLAYLLLPFYITNNCNCVALDFSHARLLQPARYFTEATTTTSPVANTIDDDRDHHHINDTSGATAATMDDEPILSAESGNTFKPLRTVPDVR